MLHPGDQVIVACSGGADSTALLLCLNQLAPELLVSLTVAHLNHRIRGAEAAADEDFVRRLSSDLGLPFVSEAVEIKQQAYASKQNLEELARQRRYEFLRQVAAGRSAQKIAVGHTLNDQAETILFRFIRGSGIEGLSAIHPVVEAQIIRPLLNCSRADISAYLMEQGVRHRDDSSNLDLQYARNRIRQELLPYLEKTFNPRLIRTLATEAELAREAWSFIESEAKRFFASLCSPLENGLSFSICELLALHPAMQKFVVRHGIKELSGSLKGISSRHIQRILSLCKQERGGGRAMLPHGYSALRQFDALHLLKQAPSVASLYSYPLSVPGICEIPEAGAILKASICSYPGKSRREHPSLRVYLDAKSLPDRLFVRSRMPGDRYGGQGHRKTKKMLIDRKILAHERDILPMVAAGQDVIWIPGFRPARNYEALPSSDSCVMLEFSQDSEK
jgi:tRNA(Ile)-lysidine synthase